MRQRLSEDERKSAILEAAFSVAARERLDAVTTRRVAEVAGVSAGLVIFHFESKDKLLLALCEQVVDEVRLAFAGAPSDSDRPAREALVQFLSERVANFERPRVRERIELFFDFWVLSTRAPAVRHRLVRAMGELKALLGTFAQRVIDDEPERFTDVSAAQLASTLVALLHGAAIQRVVEGKDYDGASLVRSVRALLGAAPSAQKVSR
ncbi:MAG: TetR/AcrR family transcriptional regulator [Polyangiales bacterium]